MYGFAVELPEQALVACTLHTGVPLGPEALSYQLEPQRTKLQILRVSVIGLQLLKQPSEDRQETAEGLLLHSIPENRRLDGEENTHTQQVSDLVQTGNIQRALCLS